MFMNDLPKYIAREVLNNWLTMKQVCLLDKAVCNSVERPRLLLQLDDVRVDGLNSTYVSQCYMKWLTVRKVKIDTLTLKMDDFTVFKPDNSTFDCLKHLKALDIDCTKSTVEDDFVLLIMKCSGLTNLRLVATSSFSSNKKTVRTIANSCPTLAALRVEFRTSNKHVQDDDFIHLANQCKMLRSVYINNWKMNQKCFEAFVNGCDELSEISYNTAADVNTVPYEITAITTTHTVTGLYLSPDCIGLDFDCTEQSTSRLQHVNLLGCVFKHGMNIINFLSTSNCCNTLREMTLMDLNEKRNGFRYVITDIMLVASIFTSLQLFRMVTSSTHKSFQPTQHSIQLTGSQRTLTSVDCQVPQYESHLLLNRLRNLLATFPNLTELSVRKLHRFQMGLLSSIVEQLSTRPLIMALHCTCKALRIAKAEFFGVPTRLQSVVRVEFLRNHVEITSI